MAVNKSSPLFSSCVGEVNLSSSPRAFHEPKAFLSRVPPVQHLQLHHCYSRHKQFCASHVHQFVSCPKGIYSLNCFVGSAIDFLKILHSFSSSSIMWINSLFLPPPRSQHFLLRLPRDSSYHDALSLLPTLSSSILLHMRKPWPECQSQFLKIVQWF